MVVVSGRGLENDWKRKSLEVMCLSLNPRLVVAISACNSHFNPPLSPVVLLRLAATQTLPFYSLPGEQ